MNSSSSSQPAAIGPCMPPRNITTGLTIRKPTIVSLYQSGAWPRKLRANACASPLGIRWRSGLAAAFRFSASPHRLAAADLVDHCQNALVRREFVVARTYDSQHSARPRRCRRLMRDADVDLCDLAKDQRGLAAGHREIDVQQNLRVEQRAVQLAMRVVDFVALAQCIEAVALA